MASLKATAVAVLSFIAGFPFLLIIPISFQADCAISCLRNLSLGPIVSPLPSHFPLPFTAPSVHCLQSFSFQLFRCVLSQRRCQDSSSQPRWTARVERMRGKVAYQVGEAVAAGLGGLTFA